MPSPILGGDALVSCPSPTEALSCSSSEAAALPASLPHALASLLPWAAPAYSPGWSQAPAGFLPPVSRGPSGMCGGLHSLWVLRPHWLTQDALHHHLYFVGVPCPLGLQPHYTRWPNSVTWTQRSVPLIAAALGHLSMLP